MYRSLPLLHLTWPLVIALVLSGYSCAPSIQAGGLRRVTVAEDNVELGYRTRHAIIIGIDRYATGELKNLEGAHFDAAELANVLASRFGFEDVTLVLDRHPEASVQHDGVKLEVVQAGITAAGLRSRLESLVQRVDSRDALLFYYAGHGIRVADRGYLACADSDPQAVGTMLDIADAAKLLRACQAHHTLMLLDCCFSGVALEEGSGVSNIVANLPPAVLRVSGTDNLDRVFGRRAFQIITAGTGEEPVGDLAKLSQEYAGLAAKFPEFQGHSPFMAVLLQALRGLTGRADGKLLASDLGYYMNYTLVNDERVRAIAPKQAPRSQTLAGEGDFVFFPAHRVLNPKLIAPLYLMGPEYGNLRQSSCQALETFVASQELASRIDLVRATVPHVHRLLTDEVEQTRQAACVVLANFAEKYGSEVPEFAGVVGTLADILANESEVDIIRREAARAIGELQVHAVRDEKVVASFEKFVTGLASAWDDEQRAVADSLKMKVEDFALPPELNLQLARIGQPTALGQNATAMERLTHLELVRRRMSVLSKSSLQPFLDRHNRGKAFLARSEALLADQSIFAAKQMVARALGDNSSQDSIPGEVVPRLFPRTPEWESARSILLTPPHRELVWCSPLRVHHDGALISVVYSPDGKYISSSSEDGAVRLWNADSGRLLWQTSVESPTLYYNQQFRQQIAFSADATLLAIASGQSVKVFETVGAREIGRFNSGGERINCVAFCRRDGRCAIGGDKGTIWIWNAVRRKLETQWSFGFIPSDDDPRNGEGGRLYSDSVYAIAFSPSGTAVAASGNNDWIRVWGLEPSVKPITLEGHQFRIGALEYSIDGKLLASASQDGTVRLWDTTSHKQLALFDLPKPESSLSSRPYCNDVAFALDMSEMAAAYSDGLIRRWRMSDRKVLTPIRAHESGVRSLGYSPDGRTLTCVGSDTRYWPAERRRGDRVIRFFDRESGRERTPTAGSLDHLMHLSFSPDGKSIVTGAADRSVVVWDVATGKSTTGWSDSDAFPNSAAYVEFADGGIVLVCANGEAWGRDVATGKVRWKLDRTKNRSNGGFTRMAVSPDKRTIAVKSHNQIRFLKADSSEELRTLTLQVDDVNDESDVIAFSPDGKRIAYSRKSSIAIFDLATMNATRVIKRPESHGRILTAPQGLEIAFSPDGVNLAFISEASVHICNSSTSEIVHKLTGPARFLNTIAYSPDGRFLASGGDDQELFLWDASSGELIARYAGHTAPVYCVAFSPEGSLIASCGADATLRLWNAMSDEQTQLKGHTHDVRSMTYSPDGLTLISSSMDDTMRVWDMTTHRATHVLDGGKITAPDYRMLSNDKWVAASTEGSSIKVWTESTSSPVVLRSTMQLSAGVTISPDGRLLAVEHYHRPNGGRVGEDPDIEIWDRTSSRLVAALRGPKTASGGWQRTTFSPDGALLAAQSYHNHRIWNVQEKKFVAKFEQNLLIKGTPVFSPDSKLVLYCDDKQNNSVGVYNSRTGELLRSMPTGKSIQEVRLSPDGRFVAVAVFEGGVQLWDLHSGQRVASPYDSRLSGTVFGFSNDGKFLASAVSHVSDRNTSLFDIEGNVELSRFKYDFFPEGRVFSPNGRAFLTWGLANWGGFPQIWDVKTGEEVARLSTRKTEHVTCAPDGSSLVLSEKFSANLADRKTDYWISVRNWPYKLESSRYQSVRRFHDLEIRWSVALDNLYSDALPHFSIPPGSLIHHLRAEGSAQDLDFGLLVRFVQAKNATAADMLYQRMPEGPWKQRARRILVNFLRVNACELIDNESLGLAEIQLERALELSPLDAESLFQFGRLDASRFETDRERVLVRCVEHLSAALSQGFDDYDRWLSDELFEAIRTTPKYLAMENSRIPVSTFVKRARAIVKQQPAVAIALCERALEREAENVDALTTRGYAHARNGEFDNSLEDFDHVTRLRGNDPWSFYNLACGLSLRAKSRPESEVGKAARQADVAAAVRSLERAIEKGWRHSKQMEEDEDLWVVRVDYPAFADLVRKAAALEETDE